MKNIFKIQNGSYKLELILIEKSSRFFEIWEEYGKTHLDYSIFCGEWCTEQQILSDIEEKDNFTIIGKLSELDKELEKFVDWMFWDEPIDIKRYKNYFNPIGLTYPYKSIKESFISLVKSQHHDFKKNKEYLLIKLNN